MVLTGIVIPRWYARHEVSSYYADAHFECFVSYFFCFRSILDIVCRGEENMAVE